jgi:putative molybdopterin biosynthesis protein
MADIAFGVEAAAALFNLEFIPITEDQYYWAYEKESEDDPQIKSFLQMLDDKNLQNEINQLPGYQCHNAGAPISIKELFQ